MQLGPLHCCWHYVLVDVKTGAVLEKYLPDNAKGPAPDWVKDLQAESGGP